MTETMPPVRRNYLDTPDGQLHYRSAGNGVPLLLLHQTSNSSAQWLPVIPRFAARGYRVIVPDFPGCGMSDPPPTKPDVAYYAGRLMEMADLLGINSFLVFGHHTGALLGAIMASTHPDRVNGLAMWGYPNFSPERRAALSTSGPGVVDDEGQFLVNAWQGRKKMSNPGMSNELSVRVMIDRLLAGPISHWTVNAVGGVDPVALAQRVKVPSLMICGQHDSAWQESQNAIQNFVNIQSVVIENASMDVADEQPDELVDQVDRFFKGIGSRT